MAVLRGLIETNRDFWKGKFIVIVNSTLHRASELIYLDLGLFHTDGSAGDLLTDPLLTGDEWDRCQGGHGQTPLSSMGSRVYTNSTVWLHQATSDLLHQNGKGCSFFHFFFTGPGWTRR